MVEVHIGHLGGDVAVWHDVDGLTGLFFTDTTAFLSCGDFEFGGSGVGVIAGVVIGRTSEVEAGIAVTAELAFFVIDEGATAVNAAHI